MEIEAAQKLVKEGWVLKPDSLVTDMEKFFIAKGMIAGWNLAVKECSEKVTDHSCKLFGKCSGTEGACCNDSIKDEILSLQIDEKERAR